MLWIHSIKTHLKCVNTLAVGSACRNHRNKMHYRQLNGKIAIVGDRFTMLAQGLD